MWLSRALCFVTEELFSHYCSFIVCVSVCFYFFFSLKFLAKNNYSTPGCSVGRSHLTNSYTMSVLIVIFCEWQKNPHDRWLTSPFSQMLNFDLHQAVHLARFATCSLVAKVIRDVMTALEAVCYCWKRRERPHYTVTMTLIILQVSHCSALLTPLCSSCTDLLFWRIMNKPAAVIFIRHWVLVNYSRWWRLHIKASQ